MIHMIFHSSIDDSDALQGVKQEVIRLSKSQELTLVNSELSLDRIQPLSELLQYFNQLKPDSLARHSVWEAGVGDILEHTLIQHGLEIRSGVMDDGTRCWMFCKKEKEQ